MDTTQLSSDLHAHIMLDNNIPQTLHPGAHMTSRLPGRNSGSTYSTTLSVPLL